MAHLKLSTVYMDGKNKYLAKEKEVKSLISQYSSASANNFTKVIYCFDYVWFCRDIERVYLGEKVEDGQKNREATKFKVNKLIDGVSESKLKGKSFGANMSNILSVLDKFKPYLVRK